MKTHYIFVPYNGKAADFCTSASLRQLCDHFGLKYANADYQINRKKKDSGVFYTVTGKVFKVAHLEGLKRGVKGGF